MPGNHIVIIGSGPAGLACAHTLVKNGYPSLVVEKEGVPGGLCRTVNFGGYLFDIGGHRFLTHLEEISTLWKDFMQDDLLNVQRLSRIYYKKRYFNYPLSFFNTFWNLGPLESFLCISSYLSCKCFKPGDDTTFEGWITNRFGRRLYDIFFKTYTEKIWFTPCQDISADWARQRILGLSLRVAIQKALLGRQKNSPKTLSDEFLYPKKGPGIFYEKLKESIFDSGGRFKFRTPITEVRHDTVKIISVLAQKNGTGEKEELPVDYLFSSMPLPTLIKSLRPKPPADILEVADKLSFRSFITVNIILDKKDLFPDQWIYIHTPEVRLGRIQNYKNWSKDMVADSKKTSLGLEYFCREGDNLWSMNDVDLVDFAVAELEKIGIVSRRYLINGFVLRCPNAYPVYALDYRTNIDILRAYLGRFSNLTSMGRAGLFRYGNSDFALQTGICGARKFLGTSTVNLWEL